MPVYVPSEKIQNCGRKGEEYALLLSFVHVRVWAGISLG